MPIARSYPVRFTPRGLVDSLDATDKFPGACIQLSDLVFDQLNPEIMVARPGVKVQADFSTGGFMSPGVVSVHITIGDVTYGLIATARNTGKDEPFAYDNAAQAFIAISGVTNANSPSTPSASGTWNPPTMAAIGTKIIVTHPGFPGGATKFGWFDISTPSTPAWTAGDLTTQPLPSTPVSVSNFNNRAYYACGQFLPFSDVLDPVTRTNASQVLTIGDTSPLTALSGLPVQTTSSGVVQTLLVYKASQVWQVTGDVVSNSLAQNFLSLSIGCRAPRSIWQSPYGTYFISDGGPYLVDLLGSVRPLTNKGDVTEPDVQAPFQNATSPSRAAGCYSSSIYRVCLETVVRGESFFGDYWFDEHRRRWNGPHSFQFDCASQYMNYMILSSSENPGKLYKSQLFPDTTSQYTDDATVYTPTLQSSTFPKEGHMVEKQVVESTQELSNAGATTTYTIESLDEQENTLDTVQITVPNAGAVWGSFVWGDGTKYASATNRPKVYNVEWTQTIVFQKMAIRIQATATSSLSIGTFFARYQETGYVNSPNPDSASTTGTPIDNEVQIPILIE